MTLPISECRSGAIILALVRRPTETTELTLKALFVNATLFAWLYLPQLTFLLFHTSSTTNRRGKPCTSREGVIGLRVNRPELLIVGFTGNDERWNLHTIFHMEMVLALRHFMHSSFAGYISSRLPLYRAADMRFSLHIQSID